jgi:hypothetical protein
MHADRGGDRRLAEVAQKVVGQLISGNNGIAELVPGLRVARPGLQPGELVDALEADLGTVDRAIGAARAKLSDYTSNHEAAINTAKAEAEALMSEYESLDLQGLEEARDEMKALQSARSQEKQLLVSQQKEQRIVEFVKELISVYSFQRALPARLADGRKDPAILAQMAGELGEMRQLVETLPMRNGKPPTLNKIINPLLRDMAKRVRAGVRMGVSRTLLLSSESLQVRLIHDPAPNKGSKSGGGITQSCALCESLTALERLAAHEDETGGRKGGGAGGGGGGAVGSDPGWD